MNKQDKKVPTLRFKGFTNDWEQRKLGEISTSFSGGTPSVKNKSYYGGKIPFIRSAEIHKNKTELFITESGLKNSSAKLIKKGTLLYALYGATSGEVDVSNIDGAINQAIMAIFLQKDNVSFIKYYLEKNKDKIIAKYLQGGQGNLSASIIKSVHINLPFTEEQLKISNLIKKVESLISLQQRKLELLKEIKKGFLQKMFADKDAKHPVLRFNGYSGDWEQRKLGDIAKIVAGGDKDNSMINSEGRYPVIANSVNTDGIIGYYSKKFRIKAPAITVTGRGDIGNATPRFINFTPVVRLLALTTPHNVVFIANAINKIRIFNESTGVPQLTAPQLSKYKIGITDYQEESIIAGLISTMEIALSLQQQKLAKYQSIKKSLLQQMFI